MAPRSGKANTSISSRSGDERVLRGALFCAKLPQESALAQLLELELNRKLRNAWRRRFQDLPKRRVADIAIDRTASIKLSMVERIEGFQAQFE